LAKRVERYFLVISSSKKIIDETWAKSEPQAKNFLRFRGKIPASSSLVSVVLAREAGQDAIAEWDGSKIEVSPESEAMNVEVAPPKIVSEQLALL
jgi:hypothetical protein